MNKKLIQIAERIDRKISDKTGITSKEAIRIYDFICTHADFNDGVIMSGDVIHDIYRDLLSKSSKPMQVLDEVYWNVVANLVEVPLCSEFRDFKSPLSRKAEQVFSEYLQDFSKRGLIGISREFAFGERYPVLIGYNYFNDNEFYEKTGTKNSQGRILRI
jgi:RNAse (barnase) inhibitor barstar